MGNQLDDKANVVDTKNFDHSEKECSEELDSENEEDENGDTGVGLEAREETEDGEALRAIAGSEEASREESNSGGKLIEEPDPDAEETKRLLNEVVSHLDTNPEFMKIVEEAQKMLPDLETAANLNEEEEGLVTKNKQSKTTVCEDFKKRSKSQVKNERLKIHSETQRLMRERGLSIPYHVPKQRTLKEFLGRKRNWGNIPLNTPPSKMLEVWKDIEENAKNAGEFFKSDSESDVDEGVSKEKETEVEKVEADSNVSSEVAGLLSEILKDCPENVMEAPKDITGDNQPIVAPKLISPLPGPSRLESFDFGEGRQEEAELAESGREAENGGQTHEDNAVDEKLDRNEASKVVGGPSKDGESFVPEDLPVVSSSDDAQQRTSDWVDSILVRNKNPKKLSKKQQLLNKLFPKLLKITPKLSGAPDSFIDLRENKEAEMAAGAKRLKARFFGNRPPPKHVTAAEVVSSTNDVEASEAGGSSLELLKAPVYGRPGGKLQKLREELKKKIEDKWEEEHKRQMTEMEAEKARRKEEEKEEGKSETDDEETWSAELESSESEEVEEEEEFEKEDGRKRKRRNPFVDDEAEESDGDEEMEEGAVKEEELEDDSPSLDVDPQIESQEKEDDKENDPYATQSSQIPPYQPGGGLLRETMDLIHCDEESLPESTPSPTYPLDVDYSPVARGNPPSSSSSSPPPSPTAAGPSQETWDFDISAILAKPSFVPRFPENETYDLSDAYEFCSGTFPDGPQEAVAPPGEDSQNDNFVTSELPEESTKPESHSIRKSRQKRRIVDEDEDDDGGNIFADADTMRDIEAITSKKDSSYDEPDTSSTHKENKNLKVHKKNVIVSDDEEDENEKEDSDKEESDDSEDDEDGAKDTGEPMFDSEEEEINPAEFFEKEAELSGDEDDWSGDEDEKDLDVLDEEDGDQDKLDDKKVRSQLQKIHRRRLLDDDARDIRLLQELLLEDGDLHDDGPKREKNYKWNNLATAFDEDKREDCEGAEGPYVEEEDENAARARHEKELFLLQMKKEKGAGDDDDDDEDDEDSLLKRGRVVLERFRKQSSSTVRERTDDLNEFPGRMPFGLINTRGSFLTRDEEFLSKLAKYTTTATDNILGPKHSKNFVFTPKSPVKQPPTSKENSHPKRKSSSSEDDSAKSKRPRLSGASLLDKLLGKRNT